MFFFNKLEHPGIRRFVSACLIVLIISATLFVVLPTPKAEALALGYPFGGLSLWVQYCTCSFNLMVTVGPPRPGIFMYEPLGTILYSFYQIYRPGVFLLGLAGPLVSTCLMYVGKGCAPVGGGLVMTIVGTSL